MMIAIGVLAGLVWGALCGLANAMIMKKAVEKNNSSLVLGANVLRIGVDLLALLAVFLLRGALPFPYEATLVGTAVALSIVTIIFAFRFGKKMK